MKAPLSRGTSAVVRPHRRLAATAVAGTLVALALTGAASATPTKADAAAAKTEKVLVIGLDGAMLEKIKQAQAPNLKQLISGGVSAQSTLYANPVAETSSGPGWATILTGVWPAKHGVKDNSFTGKNFTAYPDFLTRANTAKPALDVTGAATWDQIVAETGGGAIISPSVDRRINGGTDVDTANQVSAHLKNDPADVTFVQQDDIDHAGHSTGSGSPEYLAEIANVDARVGQMLAAVKSRATYASENWTVLVSADHGHKPTGGHGGNTPEERQTFVIANGPGYTPGTVRNDIRMVDTAATVLSTLGVPLPAGLDGVPVKNLQADSFDAARPSLQASVDETGIPQTVKGFTHTGPNGWTVDNSAMGTGGVTEWRGWAFTTDEFWARAEPGQGRENFTAGRNVIAVADPDEWTDKTRSGKFDSSLVSPKISVPAGPLKLTYSSYYQQSGSQVGQVWVSYNGGAMQLVKTHNTSQPSSVESISLAAPAGTTTVQVKFRIAGDNDWYWAVDNVKVG